MRPRSPVLVTLAYGAGLATGLLRFGAPGAATLALGAVAVAVPARFRIVAAAAAGGRVIGELT
ncbi:MAG TPA: hypothetical protein VEB59_00345, partial [Gemmatimonadales bacterium]|nr:hypothetical protein [Gemmatimonadales bacterium]